MSYKLNPFTGMLDIVGSGGFFQLTKFNPFTGQMDITAGGIDNLKYNPFSGKFDIEGGTFSGATPEEIAALMAFYDATDGPNWDDATGWGKYANVEEWFGVGVSGGVVTVLSLSNNNLSGTLPAVIGDLVNLNNLNLTGNNLTGAIPTEIGNLNPAFLSLGSNAFTSVPASISNLSNTSILNLSNNNLIAIEPEIYNMSSLAFLWLYANQITSVPIGLNNLTTLKSLLLFDNTTLSGTFPTLAGMTVLQQLHVYNNLLSGALPSVAGLTALTDINVRTNSMTGSDTIASEIYANRMGYIEPDPVLTMNNIGDTVSGDYEYSPSPSSGGQHIYALVNDDDSEGFSKWVITYTT